MPKAIVVQAPSARYEGTRSEDGASVFAGIPFAAPPIGPLRFRQPQRVPDTTGVIDATRFRSAPAQVGSALRADSGSRPKGATAPRLLAALAAAAAGIESGEDCLYLNVWSPDVDGASPVIVWIYGGGFDTGSAAPPITAGAALSRLTGTVVVAMNYRVGALGFGYWVGVGGEEWAASSNLGLQDQIAALAWVRRNIAAFGGDPARITVAGESAGAFCIGSLLAIPEARAGFDRAILQSGNLGRIFSTDTATSMARDLMDLLETGTMEELQRVDLDRLLAAQSRVIDSDIGARNLPGGRSWGVVLDGTVLARAPIAAVRMGDVADVPLLMGANRDETLPFAMMQGDAWAPVSEDALRAEIGLAGAADPSSVLDAYRADRRDADAPDDLGALRTAFLTDAIYRRPVSETAVAHRAAGGHAWTLLFSAAPFGPAIGAGHGLDLLYLFDDLTLVGPASENQLADQREFADAWRAFAHEGDPGWAEYDYDATGSTRQIGGDGAMITEPAFGAVRAAWPITG